MLRVAVPDMIDAIPCIRIVGDGPGVTALLLILWARSPTLNGELCTGLQQNILTGMTSEDERKRRCETWRTQRGVKWVWAGRA
jgi:hypothetical protein